MKRALPVGISECAQGCEGIIVWFVFFYSVRVCHAFSTLSQSHLVISSLPVASLLFLTPVSHSMKLPATWTGLILHVSEFWALDIGLSIIEQESEQGAWVMKEWTSKWTRGRTWLKLHSVFSAFLIFEGVSLPEAFLLIFQHLALLVTQSQLKCPSQKKLTQDSIHLPCSISFPFVSSNIFSF
jgi:hypothetical protein